MNDSEREFSTAKNILPLILRDVSKKGLVKGELFRGWPGIVGEKLAQQTKVIDIKNNTIFVAARDGGSMQLIQLKKSQILYNLKKNYDGLGIKDIDVSLERKESQPCIKSQQKAESIENEENKVKSEKQDADFDTLLKKIYGYSKEL